MILVAGLGNPGAEYVNTRHNAGFLVAQHFRLTRGFGRTRKRYLGRWCEGTLQGYNVAILLPQTYMNRSGESVASAAGRKHISLEDIIIIHDDMDFPLGVVRARSGGGLGGHNGLQSVAGVLGSTDFNRVRVGIGRPDDPMADQADWVLSHFGGSSDELAAVIETAADCVEAIITEGIDAAMSSFNRREQEEEE